MSGCYAIFHKQLGDLLLLEPTLAKLCAHYGGPIRVMTRGGHEDLLGLMPGVRFVSGPALVPQRVAWCFDTLHKTAIRSIFAPVLERRAVFIAKDETSWWHSWIFNSITVPELKDHYVAKYYWENTAVPSSDSFRPPRLNRPPEDWKLPFPAGKYVLCNPTSGWKKKCWTTDQWAKLLHQVHDRTNLPAIIVGGSNEWQLPHCREIAEKCGSIAHCLAGETSLKNFIWLAANAKMVLTVDGSASHLAAAFDVPCVTLFGPTSIHNWHWPTPIGIALKAPKDERGEQKLRNLPVETAWETVEKLWSQIGSD